MQCTPTFHHLCYKSHDIGDSVLLPRNFGKSEKSPVILCPTRESNLVRQSSLPPLDQRGNSYFHHARLLPRSVTAVVLRHKGTFINRLCNAATAPLRHNNVTAPHRSCAHWHGEMFAELSRNAVCAPDLTRVLFNHICSILRYCECVWLPPIIFIIGIHSLALVEKG
ncbi:hypothetical protein SFRURICE_006687 [Spodoptera frugiperda]|nr:hypothetical protein SFRURICE_006687 [Spodoptera frugiperda]